MDIYFRNWAVIRYPLSFVDVRLTTHVVAVIDTDHWSVDAGSQTFHFTQRKLLVGGSLAGMNSCKERIHVNQVTRNLSIKSRETCQSNHSFTMSTQ